MQRIYKHFFLDWYLCILALSARCLRDDVAHRVVFSSFFACTFVKCGPRQTLDSIKNTASIAFCELRGSPLLIRKRVSLSLPLKWLCLHPVLRLFLRMQACHALGYFCVLVDHEGPTKCDSLVRLTTPATYPPLPPLAPSLHLCTNPQVKSSRC